MSWRDELHLVPTRNKELLSAIVGRRIVALKHYAEDPLADLLASDAYESRGIQPNQLFALADGPALVELDGIGAFCISESEPMMSVTIEVADCRMLAEDWQTSIDAMDPAYSESRFARIVGRRVLGARVLQRFVDPERLEEQTRWGTRVMSHKVLERPREGILAFDLDDASQLIFGLELVDSPNNLAVLTESDLGAPGVPTFHEVLRVP